MKRLSEIIKAAENLDKYPFNEKCFLCNKDLSKSNKTKEHIFPKWIIKEFSLSKYSLRISNNSLVKYSSLLIPACDKCNNEYLSKMEKRVKVLRDLKFKNLSFEDELILAQWSAKILLGSVFKETTLSSDLANRESKKILHPSWLKNFDLLYAILQTCKYNYEVNGETPWSIINLEFSENCFSYFVNILDRALVIQLGNFGFAIKFGDSNLVKKVLDSELDLYPYKALKFKDLGENDLRIILAMIVTIDYSISRKNKTLIHYDSKFREIRLVTEPEGSYGIKWTSTEQKRFELLFSATNPEELLDIKQITSQELKEDKR